ncbi:tryptophan halogenase family protein [Agaribacterium sp. ZY112]|uniref:tryptophan halogenase family protein n=1 Tax=Agaribacterium sp. ZY112 TaxID=3233574 RepID=UPI00352695E7
MQTPITSILIVGGGTAGWLSAGIIASSQKTRIANGELTVTLCESANIATVGVGEGTWPTMRITLKKMGVSESELFRECEASFKQGSKFVNWSHDQGPNHYYHPFQPPQGFPEVNVSEHWLHSAARQSKSFSRSFCEQEAVCEQQKAPKTITNAEYDPVLNYGYHLNAAVFSKFLNKHCTKKLGVKHIVADITAVALDKRGAIASVQTEQAGELSADLYIDCSGFKSLLLGEALGVKYKSIADVLFADTALAMQVPYSSPEVPIQSATMSIAQDAGWIWDIGLPSRRGVGHVFSSAYMSVDEATQKLHSYIGASGGKPEGLDIKEIRFNAGYREKFWHKNCVAVGLSAGFIEPLEAAALMMIELSAQSVSEQLPKTQEALPISARRFNESFSYRWQRIVEFLKLHYVLSRRSSPFWLDNKDAASIPESLQELLLLWQHSTPAHTDFGHVKELFGAASFQYVLYGMDHKASPLFGEDKVMGDYAETLIARNTQRLKQLLSTLPSNRELIEKIHKYGLSKI